MKNVYFILKEKSHVYGYVYVYTPRLHVYKKLLNAAALNDEAQLLNSPLCSRVFPLCGAVLVVDEVHSSVVVHALLCTQKTRCKQ